MLEKIIFDIIRLNNSSKVPYTNVLSNLSIQNEVLDIYKISEEQAISFLTVWNIICNINSFEINITLLKLFANRSLFFFKFSLFVFIFIRWHHLGYLDLTCWNPSNKKSLPTIKSVDVWAFLKNNRKCLFHKEHLKVTSATKLFLVIKQRLMCN